MIVQRLNDLSLAFSGFTHKINADGVNYYKNLISELKINNIEPLITLYHWDLPQSIQDAGGWTSERIVNWFAYYARVCFEIFGNEVKYWMTFNEAKQTCQLGYGSGIFAPGISSGGIGEYICAHHVLKAHAEVWHIYDREFRQQQNGSNFQ